MEVFTCISHTGLRSYTKEDKELQYYSNKQSNGAEDKSQCRATVSEQRAGRYSI